MKVMEEKLQKCNEELSQASDHQKQLEKQLKSTEVGDDKLDIYSCENNENIMSSRVKLDA